MRHFNRGLLNAILSRASYSQKRPDSEGRRIFTKNSHLTDKGWFLNKSKHWLDSTFNGGHIMQATLTISIPTQIKSKLEKVSKEESLRKGEIVRDALKQYFAQSANSKGYEKWSSPKRKSRVFLPTKTFLRRSHEGVFRYQRVGRRIFHAWRLQ